MTIIKQTRIVYVQYYTLGIFVVSGTCESMSTPPEVEDALATGTSDRVAKHHFLHQSPGYS
jgi:hypothetical protein